MMTERGTENAPHLDALLPQEMARRAEEIGARKVAMDALGTLALAVLAGAFIALGGVFATTTLAGTGAAPWGAMRVLAGVTFSLGLILVIVGGAELFTGNALIVMAWASRRVTTGAVLRNWLIVFGGNFLGAAATAGLVFLGGIHQFGGGGIGVTALAIAHAKLQFGFGQAVALGILCNALVCLAVWLSYSARTTADRVLAIVPPITLPIVTGRRFPRRKALQLRACACRPRSCAAMKAGSRPAMSKPSGTKYMFAIECSKPAATNALIGGTMARIRSAVVRAL